MAFEYTESMLAKINEVKANLNGEEFAYDAMEALSDELGVPSRSLSAKMRNMGVAIAKKAKAAKSWTDEEAERLANAISAGATDVEIAERLGKTVRQVRGKALSMNLIQDLKIVKAETAEPVRTFSDEETEKVISMVDSGSYVEDIAEALGKTVRQITGKLLSLKLTAPRKTPPKVKEKVYNDEMVSLVTQKVEAGETAEAIAADLGLNLTGLKSFLGKHGLKTPDMGSSKPTKYTDEDYATMAEMAAEGKTIEEVAEVLGRSLQSVRVVAGRQKIAFNKAVEDAA